MLYLRLNAGKSVSCLLSFRKQCLYSFVLAANQISNFFIHKLYAHTDTMNSVAALQANSFSSIQSCSKAMKAIQWDKVGYMKTNIFQDLNNLSQIPARNNIPIKWIHNCILVGNRESGIPTSACFREDAGTHEAGECEYVKCGNFVFQCPYLFDVTVCNSRGMYVYIYGSVLLTSAVASE